MTRLSLVLILLAATAAGAQPVTVLWDPNPPGENVTGYVLHHGPVSRGDAPYIAQVDVGNVTEHSIDLPVGEHLALTAYNGAGLSSDYSVELRVGAAPTVPGAPAGPMATTTVVDGLGRAVTVTVTVEVQ